MGRGYSTGCYCFNRLIPFYDPTSFRSIHLGSGPAPFDWLDCFLLSIAIRGKVTRGQCRAGVAAPASAVLGWKSLFAAPPIKDPSTRQQPSLINLSPHPPLLSNRTQRHAISPRLFLAPSTPRPTTWNSINFHQTLTAGFGICLQASIFASTIPFQTRSTPLPRPKLSVSLPRHSSRWSGDRLYRRNGFVVFQRGWSSL